LGSRRIGSVSAKATRAGSTRLRLRFTPAGRRQLGFKRRVVISVGVRFQPAWGGTARSSVKVTLKR
jgi:hypothetical protein